MLSKNPALVLMIFLTLLAVFFMVTDAVFDANMKSSSLRTQVTEEELAEEYECWMLLAERGGIAPEDIKELCQP